MTFKLLMEELFPSYVPMTSNKLKEILHLNHTEQCRRWLRGTFLPSDKYILALAIESNIDVNELKTRINALSS